MVATLLPVFDIFVGECEHMKADTDAKRTLIQLYRSKDLQVTTEHVQRAYDIIGIFYCAKDLSIKGLRRARRETQSAEATAAERKQETDRQTAAALTCIDQIYQANRNTAMTYIARREDQKHYANGVAFKFWIRCYNGCLHKSCSCNQVFICIFICGGGRL